jgi:Mechanosensitive ion channel, conserved TM helix
MGSPLQDALDKVGQKFIGYLPNLIAGIVLIAIGWIAGWVVKRVLVQICVLLRMEKFMRRFHWGEEFSKADVRYAGYNFVGNVGFIIVFLLFLNAALDALQLTVISNLVEQGVRFVPKAAIAVIMFIVGWIVANWVSVSLQHNLIKEEIPRASLIARFSKVVLILTFSAMALVEMDIAREIVIIAFTAMMVTFGILAIVFSLRSGKDFVERIFRAKNEE